jgi:hypothetical protein
MKRGMRKRFGKEEGRKDLKKMKFDWGYGVRRI